MPTGYRELDRITAGFQPSNLIILAARPGMGKTSLALNIAAHVGIREQLPVAIFSIEMSRDEVTQRLMCSEGKVDSSRLRTGKLAPDEWPKLTAACSPAAGRRRSTSTTPPASRRSRSRPRRGA